MNNFEVGQIVFKHTDGSIFGTITDIKRDAFYIEVGKKVIEVARAYNDFGWLITGKKERLPSGKYRPVYLY